MTGATEERIDDVRPDEDEPASEERRDVIREWPAQALHAALDRSGEPPKTGDPLPPFWRWLYFLEARRRGDLGRDGHPARGVGLIPDLGLPRRMWAGGRLEFRKPLPIGANATLTSSVSQIARKEGRSGPLAFVTLRHEALTRDGLCQIEEQDLVYRTDPDPNAPSPDLPEPPEDAVWRRPWIADPTLLFRYSALTFNGHRIHYDVEYAREVEGYGGLVVHGPLLATLMLELLREQGPDRPLRRFMFRAVSPVLHSEAFEVAGKPIETEEGEGAELWVSAPDLARGGARLAMRGKALFR